MALTSCSRMILRSERVSGIVDLSAEPDSRTRIVDAEQDMGATIHPRGLPPNVVRRLPERRERAREGWLVSNCAPIRLHGPVANVYI